MAALRHVIHTIVGEIGYFYASCRPLLKDVIACCDEYLTTTPDDDTKLESLAERAVEELSALNSYLRNYVQAGV